MRPLKKEKFLNYLKDSHGWSEDQLKRLVTVAIRNNWMINDSFCFPMSANDLPKILEDIKNNVSHKK